jgi:hypothetical protein
MLREPAEPWLSFLNEIDAGLEEITELHCLGGFAVIFAYAFARATVDIDVISVTSYAAGARLLAVAGKDSELRRKHGAYLDIVTIATVPEDYESRLICTSLDLI